MSLELQKLCCFDLLWSLVYRLDNRGTVVRFQARTEDFFFLLSALTNTVPHPASHSVAVCVYVRA
jgi:hypothetical protein